MIVWWILRCALEGPCLGWIAALAALVAALLAVWAYQASRNVTVYELTEPGYAFKPLKRYRITKRHMLVDLTKLKQYPEDWVIEIKPRTATRLYGRELTIRTKERGDVVHKLYGLDTFGGYWYAIPPDAEDGDWF